MTLVLFIGTPQSRLTSPYNTGDPVDGTRTLSTLPVESLVPGNGETRVLGLCWESSEDRWGKRDPSPSLSLPVFSLLILPFFPPPRGK